MWVTPSEAATGRGSTSAAPGDARLFKDVSVGATLPARASNDDSAAGAKPSSADSGELPEASDHGTDPSDSDEEGAEGCEGAAHAQPQIRRSARHMK